MLELTRFESEKIKSGEAEGVSRLFRSGCHHEVGQEEMLTSRYETNNGQIKAFAKVRIKSIRPISYDKISRSDRYAKMDGHYNSHSWRIHFKKKYGEVKPDTIVHRLQFIIEEMEK